MIIEASKKDYNFIGRIGENDARVIRFFVGDTQKEFPGCTFSVLNRRPNDPEAYPVNSSYFTVEGDSLLWTVMSGDLAQEGHGECEIIASLNGKILKDEIYKTRILHALDGSGTPPDPWQSWVDDVKDAADRAEASQEASETAQGKAESAQEAAETAQGKAEDAQAASEAAVSHYPYVDSTTGNWMVWDTTTGSYVSTDVHAKGDKGDKGDTGYPTDAQVATAIAAVVSNPDSPPLDRTLSSNVSAAPADMVGDLKSAIDEELGSEEETTPTLTFTDGYTISTSSGTVGQIVSSANNSVSDKISLANATGVKCYYYQGTNPYGTYFFYKSDDTYIDRGTVGNTGTAITIPSETSYMRFCCMTSKKANIVVKVTTETAGAVYTAIDGKIDKSQGVENAGKLLFVGDDGNVALKSEKDIPYLGMIPLFVSMMPDFFWVSSNEIAAFSSSLPKYKDGIDKSENNAWFKISGNEGDSYVTIITGGNGDISDLTAEEKTKPFGCVIMYDDGTYYPCNAQYLTDTTFSVYPPLKDDITAGELAQIRTGIHLSRRGYRAYSQFLYGVDPKYCEKEKYIAKYRTSDQTLPFTYFGYSAYNNFGVINENILPEYVNSVYQKKYKIGKASSYSAKTEDCGIQWTVNIKDKTGYVEFYLGIVASNDGFTVSSDYAVHCELWVDGTKIKEYVKTSKPCERICLDFDGGESATLKIYCSDWQLTTQSFQFDMITWWVNRKYKTTGEKLIPTGSVVAQLFDSWGEFYDAESAVYLHNLINADASVTVPYFNGSLSNQTSAWGKAWFYNKVYEHNPAVMLTDFGINDQISASGTSILPATISGPDGETYNNVISESIYDENMTIIMKEALNNSIVPVLVGVGLPIYQTYCKGLIDHHASVVS